jgi:CRISPR-associated protein Cas6
MSMIDLSFPVLGKSVPADHGYDLYSALSRLLPALHGDTIAFRVAPVRGSYAGNGALELQAGRSWLHFRIAADAITSFLPLAGKALELAGHPIRLGVPQVHALTPAPALTARLVTIKGFTEPPAFLAAARRQLDDLGVKGEAGIPVIAAGDRAGEPRRRILRVKEKKVVGFPLQVSALTAEESIRIQESGIGGRGKMGCGFFVPAKR